MSSDNILDFIDRTVVLEIGDDIMGKPRCSMVILLARYHLYRYNEKPSNVKYTVRTGIYKKRPAYVITTTPNYVLFRIDQESKDVYWRSGKIPRMKLDRHNYTFKNSGLVGKRPNNQLTKLWDKWGLWVEQLRLGEIVISDQPDNGCVFSVQGPRPTMEDSHTFANFGEDIKFYGVFDGHGGDRISNRLKTELPEMIHDELKYVKLDDINAVKNAIVKSFEVVDNNIYNSHTGRDGSTAICALVVEDVLYLINLGDSRGLVFEEDDIVLASRDHKPTNDLEKKRIEDADGFVMNGRVDGMLAVSRAFGDNTLKGDTYKGSKAKVSPVPDIYIKKLNEDKKYNLVLACDGLWDVMSNQDVRDRLINGATCEDLVYEALDRKTSDNVSVMIVKL